MMILLRSVLLFVLLLVVALPVPARAAAADHARLYIPRLSMDAPIDECALVDRDYVIGDGVCHLEGTATIEHDWARMVLAGHSPGVFANLVYLEVGDQVMVWDAGAVEVYRVVLITVTTIDDTRWLMPTDTETLTLITCAGDARLIIHAERES